MVCCSGIWDSSLFVVPENVTQALGKALSSPTEPLRSLQWEDAEHFHGQRCVVLFACRLHQTQPHSLFPGIFRSRKETQMSHLSHRVTLRTKCSPETLQAWMDKPLPAPRSAAGIVQPGLGQPPLVTAPAGDSPSSPHPAGSSPAASES